MTTTDQPTSEIERLWHSTDATAWRRALDRYWDFVKPSNRALEHEMEALKPSHVRQMDADQWYEWLLNKYFVWKYTTPNRYATTTRCLKRQAQTPSGRQQLLTIRDHILDAGASRIKDALQAAMQIGGLGPAGASGLLALLFPTKFGTVGQFVVGALRKVRCLPERNLLKRMNPENLTIRDSVVLIQIMRDKSFDHNKLFPMDSWTPRKVVKVLWASERHTG